jgi:hypothetical protein
MTDIRGNELKIGDHVVTSDLRRGRVVGLTPQRVKVKVKRFKYIVTAKQLEECDVVSHRDPLSTLRIGAPNERLQG